VLRHFLAWCHPKAARLAELDLGLGRARVLGKDEPRWSSACYLRLGDEDLRAAIDRVWPDVR